jgi:hypothetical protein
MQRRRLTEEAKATLPGNVVKKKLPEAVRKSHTAIFAVNIAQAKQRARIAKGLPPIQEVEYKLPDRHLLALQVRNGRSPEWGNIQAFGVYTATGQSEIDKYTAILNRSMTDWMVNGYFGGDASFRIARTRGPKSTFTY